MLGFLSGFPHQAISKRDGRGVKVLEEACEVVPEVSQVTLVISEPDRRWCGEGCCVMLSQTS